MSNQAIRFELANKSRTYFIVDKDRQKVNGVPEMLGYFSLGLKVLKIPEEASTTLRKKLDGYSAKINKELITELPCYLIGQLARNSKIDKTILPGKQLLDYCLGVIQPSITYVGGRIILVESKDKTGLLNFYENNNFEIISEIPDKKEKMYQLFLLT